jgi:hypothetical protein
MTYESFEPVELGKAELTIELGIPEPPEELDDKFSAGVAPYVEFDE